VVRIALMMVGDVIAFGLKARSHEQRSSET
jgi:hypothetical protein